jgi:uncharacterized membrane protein YkvA (DUF1232 family)
MLQTLPMGDNRWSTCPAKWQPELKALHLAVQHPDTPWSARLLARILVIYSASPLDLIPNFIPWIGRLDEALLMPLLIMLISWLMPAHVMRLSRVRVALGQQPPPIRRELGIILVLSTWLLMLSLLWLSLHKLF